MACSGSLASMGISRGPAGLLINRLRHGGKMLALTEMHDNKTDEADEQTYCNGKVLGTGGDDSIYSENSICYLLVVCSSTYYLPTTTTHISP